MSRAFKNDYADRYPLFARAAEEIATEVANTPIKILVWGPGAHGEYFDKRQRIIDCLANGIDEVMTSEQLVEAMPSLHTYNLHDQEFLHIKMCDVVFVLIIKAAKVTGSRAEVAVYRSRLEFRQKAYLIVPVFEEEEEPKSYLDQGWLGYDQAHTFQYTDEQYQHCERIRAYCKEIVEEVRKSRYFTY